MLDVYQDRRECTERRDIYFRTCAGGLLWHGHVSELSDNDQLAIMQIKELNEVLNGQRDIIGFSVEEMCRGREYDVIFV